jgi:predicted DNA binding protein
MLEVQAETPEDLQGITGTYVSQGGSVVLGGGEADLHAVVTFPACACCGRGQVIPTIESSGSFYLPPTSYREGVETYQFALHNPSLGPQVLSALPAGVSVRNLASSPVTLLGPNGDLLIPASALFLGVTGRQREALRTAASRGYYRIPRGTDDSELAHALGVSRPAFESLLRKAENRILLATLQYMPAPNSSEAPERGSPPPNDSDA